MLDKHDLQAIQDMITASEKHTKSYIDGSVDSAIRASENRSHAYIEGAIIPQLQLLAEGHQNILDTLAPKNRVEALEDEIIFIKSVMKAMTQEIAELKKAQ